MKFKVGDRVKFNSKSSIDGKPSIFEHLDGSLAEIISIDEGDQKLPYEIKFDNGTEFWMFEEHLELAIVEGPEPESETKVLTDKIAKLEKQVKLLRLMLESQGYNALAIASVLELLD